MFIDKVELLMARLYLNAGYEIRLHPEVKRHYRNIYLLAGIMYFVNRSNARLAFHEP